MPVFAQSRRVARAWARCQNCFVARVESEESHLYLLYVDVTPANIARCFKALKRNSVRHDTGSIWTSPAAFDPNCVTIHDNVAKLRSGGLAAMTIHYAKRVDGKLLELSLTARPAMGARGKKTYQVDGCALYDMIRPYEVTSQEKFEALVRHAIELEDLLRASSLYVGPDSGPDAGPDAGTETDGWRSVPIVQV
jgi:hypothetical protein